MSALPQAREAGKEPLPQRPSVARERPTPQASDAAPADRKGKSTPVKQDASLFDALLGQPETGLLPAGVPLTATAWPWLQAPDTSAPAMPSRRIWPPDNDDARASARVARSTAVSAAVERSQASARDKPFNQPQ